MGAAERGNYETSNIISVLLEHGAAESTMLHHAASSGNDMSEVVRSVLRRYDVDTLNLGRTPLFLAAVYGNAWLSKVLLEHDADVNAKDERGGGWTVLHSIVLHTDSDNLEITKLLLERGANVNAQKDGGRTPLHVAARSKGNPDAVRLLAGARSGRRGNGERGMGRCFMSRRPERIRW